MLFDQLINLLAGKPVADTGFWTSSVREYTCIYQDKDTHFTWKLHLLDMPVSVDSHSNEQTLYYLRQRIHLMERQL